MKLNKLAYLKTTEETKGVDMKHLIVLSSILSILMVLLLTLPFLNADTAFKLGAYIPTIGLVLIIPESVWFIHDFLKSRGITQIKRYNKYNCSKKNNK